jgi:citrate lyase subunit beta / citryl-CoA lyase
MHCRPACASGLRLRSRGPGDAALLLLGTTDFQLDLCIDESESGHELLCFRSQLVLASGAARRLGFGAKLCIHPKQLSAIHAAFVPTAAEFEWAQRVLAAVQQTGGAAMAVDGKMVDKPVELRARAVLAGLNHTPSIRQRP